MKVKVLYAVGLIVFMQSMVWAQGAVQVDGSSTVYPMALSMKTSFMDKNPNVKVDINTSNTSSGLKKLCTDQVDVATASRSIKPDEIKLCNQNKVEFVELPVAYDGVTLVVNSANTWAKCLTAEQLKKVWSSKSKVRTWADINPAWPKQAISFFAPSAKSGIASGTLDYFVSHILGKDGALRSDYFGSNNMNDVVESITLNRDAFGFVSYGYYQKYSKTLSVVAVDAGDKYGCIKPSRETIDAGIYHLSRNLFVYANKDRLDNPGVADYLNFILDHDNHKLVDASGYISLPRSAYHYIRSRLDNKTTGTLFGLPINKDKTLLKVLSGQ